MTTTHNTRKILLLLGFIFLFQFLLLSNSAQAAPVFSHISIIGEPFNIKYKGDGPPYYYDPAICEGWYATQNHYVDSVTGAETIQSSTAIESRNISMSYCSGMIPPPPPPPPPSGSCSISVSPTSHPGGNYSITYSWSTSGDVNSATVTGLGSGAPLGGSRTITGYREYGDIQFYVRGFYSSGSTFIPLCNRTVVVDFPTAPPPPPACSNNSDDDGDDFIDYDGHNGSPPDPGCTGPGDNNEYNPPVTCNLSGPATVEEGDTATFTWTSSGLGAQSVRVGGIADENLSGSVDIDMNNDGSVPVTLDVYSSDAGTGSIMCSDTVVVVVNPGLPQCGDGLDNDGDGFTDHGNDSTNETSDTGCDDPADDDEQPAPPQPDITIDENAINENQQTYVRWDLKSHTGTCTISPEVTPGVGIVTTDGSAQVSPAVGNTTYTITCDDTAGDYEDPYTVTDSVSVSVTPVTECNDGIDNDFDGRIDHAGYGSSQPDLSCDNDPNNDDESFDNYRPTCDIQVQDWFIPGELFTLSYASYGNHTWNLTNTDGMADRLRLTHPTGSIQGSVWQTLSANTGGTYIDREVGFGTFQTYVSGVGLADDPRYISYRTDGTKYVTIHSQIWDGGYIPGGCGTFEFDMVTSDPTLGGLGTEEPTITASAAIVRKGEPVDITWNSYGYVGDCELSPDVKFTTASPTAGGTESITQNSQTTYTYTCTAPGHSISTSTKVRVLPTLFET